MYLRSKSLRRFIGMLFLVVISDLTLSRCANPRSPTGGPKDTIPPVLISSDPETGSINFDQQSITLGFSEYINADKLTQNLIITPKTDIRFKHIVKRNQLVIKFETPFPDSTTYSLNFFDGVTDITEKTPAINLIVAFSTGEFIDSMSVSGSVRDLLTNDPSKKFIVGLYPISDSLDFLTHNPTYFTTANDSGEFSMSYIKSGDYRIMAFKDENRNLLLDPKTEDHGFTSDTLALYDSISSISVSSILQNVEPIKLINNRAIRAYHEIKFSREVDSYQISPDSIYSTITGEESDVIRIYNADQFNTGDTTLITIVVADSLSNTIQDTLKMVFNEDIRTPPELTNNLRYANNQLVNNPLYTINFNKPIVTTDTSKFVYKSDSTFDYKPDSISITWNHNKTSADLITFLNTDSIYKSLLESIVLDSALKKRLSIDSLDMTTAQTDSVKELIAARKQVEFFVEKGAFISVEKDTSTVLSHKHKKEFTQAFGTLQFSIVTEKESFRVQLLNSKKEVAYEQANTKSPVFNVRPATYSIRVLIDTNNDGKWSFGNLLENIEPEDVYIFPQEIAIRENWIVGEDIQISF